MRRLSRVVVIAALSGLTGLSLARAQQLDLGHQQMPGYYPGPSPVFPNAPPYYAPPPPPAYQPPTYQPSVPQYLPSYGGGTTGSTFNPRY